MSATTAEKNLIRAAQAWAAAERRMREVNGFYDTAKLGVTPVSPEEKYRISLKCDATEQALLDAEKVASDEYRNTRTYAYDLYETPTYRLLAHPPPQETRRHYTVIDPTTPYLDIILAGNADAFFGQMARCVEENRVNCRRWVLGEPVPQWRGWAD